MKIVRHACLLFLSSYVGLSYSQDYFNPLFLGNDVASLEDLSYLSDGGEVTPGNYYLDLYLGDNFIKNIKIQFKENAKTKRATACFTKDILKALPLNIALVPGLNNPDIASDACIDINQYIKDFSYQVDLSRVRISVSIPQLYLQSYRSTLADESDWDDGISAYLMNYDFSGSNSKTKGSSNYSSYYLNLNNRINLGAWRLYGNVYWTQNKYGSQTYNETKTNGVYLTRGINSIKSTLIIGQNSLGSNLFDAMPYIGATLASSNEMRPDNERGYAPPIRGIAETRSKLTIKQNDAIIYQTYVDPGPYDISDLSPVGTSGDYLVELTSVDGRVTSYTVPYSTLPNLLKENNYNYSATIGQLDITSSERRKFGQAGLSYGLPFQSTLYTGTQISSDFQSFGLGIAKDFGYLGALSVDAINSNAKVANSDRKTGQSYRILYSKAFVNTGTNFQLAGYRYSTSGYYTFSEAARKNNRSYYIDPLTGIETPYTTTSNRSKNTFQLNVTQSLGNYGQLYAWGNVTSYWDGKDTKSIQLGWNRTFSQLNNLMVSLNYNKNTYGASTNNVFYLSLSMPLGSRSGSNQMYASNSTTYNSTDHTYTNNTGLYGNAYDNRVEYNAYQTLNKDSQNNVSNVSAAYKSDFARVNVGTSYSSQTTQVNYGVKGGVLLHDEGVVFTREANDTAILVKAKGAEGAKLARAAENLTINQGGYALIPYATPYHYNEVELDPTSFKDNFDVQDKIKKVAPTRGAISKVVFDVERGYNFLVSVHYKNKPIRFGTIVKGVTNKSTSIANDDGTVYLTGVGDKAKYTVKWDDTTSCQFTINYGNNFKSSLVNKMTVNCQ